MLARKTAAFAMALSVSGLGNLVVTNTAEAGMFDMMNPSRWFGGGRDRDYYDRDYYYGRGRGYGPYGWGGGPYGWGGGPYGWGGGPYGWGGYPGYGYPYGGAPVVGATKQSAPERPE